MVLPFELISGLHPEVIDHALSGLTFCLESHPGGASGEVAACLNRDQASKKVKVEITAGPETR
jgi:hypothetical protein